MLIDNINYLRKYHRSIREYLINHEDGIVNKPLSIIETRSGKPTIQLNLENKIGYLHSRYDPVNEAEQLVDKYKDTINNYQHIFFYGLGLGYAVEAFTNHFPDKSFTLYEPNPSVFYHYLSQKRIEDLPLKLIKNIHLETSEQDREIFLSEFANQLDDMVLLVTLPSYERMFNEEYQKFIKQFKEYIVNKKSIFQTNVAFEKRWTINSMLNFKEVLKTPNILHDVNRDYFKDKPAIIVSAGPSLNEELENLKYIKENKSAYIFAVGSANKTLIKNGIIPDAVCTYDPQGHNYRVYNEIIENNLKDIPMLFGSSVGFETVEKYPGPKLHMITSQDTVSTYYLSNTSNFPKVINDAPSIAIVTFQLLCLLEASPIILVGQNLGYKGNYFYSSGIEYSGRKNTLSEQEINNALTVTDVDGNEILTNQTFLTMKKDLERIISLYPNAKIFNTTVGGAKITGSNYVSLKYLMTEDLKPGIINSNWLREAKNEYDKEIIKQKQDDMNASMENYKILLNSVIKAIRNIEEIKKDGQKNLLEKQFQKFDGVFRDFTNNDFFKVFIKPMVRVSLELFNNSIQSVRFNTDILYKAEVIVEKSSKFLYECQKDFHNILPIYAKMTSDIKELVNMEVR